MPNPFKKHANSNNDHDNHSNGMNVQLYGDVGGVDVNDVTNEGSQGWGAGDAQVVLNSNGSTANGVTAAGSRSSAQRGANKLPEKHHFHIDRQKQHIIVGGGEPDRAGVRTGNPSMVAIHPHNAKVYR